jgi:hypothetical protein
LIRETRRVAETIAAFDQELLSIKPADPGVDHSVMVNYCTDVLLSFTGTIG